MANGYRDLYFIEKQTDGTFSNVRTDDFGFKISTGNLSTFLIGSTGNFVNSGNIESVLIGKGVNKIVSNYSTLIDSQRSVITGFGGGTIIGGEANGIGVSGTSTRTCFNLIVGGCRNTVNTPGGSNVIIGGSLNRLGLGSELYLNNIGNMGGGSVLATGSVRDNTIIAGNHNEINGAQRSIILGGYYNCLGRNAGGSVCNNSVINSTMINGLCSRLENVSFSTILNGIANCIIGPSVPVNSPFIDSACPYSSSILNGNYANLAGSGSVLIQDGRLRGTGDLGSVNRVSYVGNQILFLDFASGINIVTGNLRFGNESLIKFDRNNNSGTLFADSTKESANNFSGPQTLTLDFASGVYISGGLYLNGNQLLISAAGTVFSPTTTAG